MEIGRITSWPRAQASQPAPAPPKPNADENANLATSSAGTTRSIEDFAGKWRGRVPRSALNRQEDLELAIEFDKKGEGVPDFRTASGDRVFLTGAVSAHIRKERNEYRVVLRRDWAVDLSPDGKVMTWVEKGGGKVTFKKQ